MRRRMQVYEVKPGRGALNLSAFFAVAALSRSRVTPLLQISELQLRFTASRALGGKANPTRASQPQLPTDKHATPLIAKLAQHECMSNPPMKHCFQGNAKIQQ